MRYTFPPLFQLKHSVLSCYAWAYSSLQFLYEILFSFQSYYHHIMEWMIVNSTQLHGMFTSLGVQVGDTYTVNSDCLCEYHFTILPCAFFHVLSLYVTLLIN